jgi:hypothetical protein
MMGRRVFSAGQKGIVRHRMVGALEAGDDSELVFEYTLSDTLYSD